mmetsp:Transcript_7904/g.26379  ORF Transcript_7904/g.26379 Transcript_7904/m.26379 type:complete len:181 (+) Transcript_7904:2-544(+)
MGEEDGDGDGGGGGGGGMGVSPARRELLRIKSFDTPRGAGGRRAGSSTVPSAQRFWEVDTQDGSIIQELAEAEEGAERYGYPSDPIDPAMDRPGRLIVPPPDSTDSKLFAGCDSIDGDPEGSIDLIDGGGFSGMAAERAMAALHVHAAERKAEEEREAAATATAALVEGTTSRKPIPRTP